MRRTVIQAAACSTADWTTVFVTREELRDGVWVPTAHGIANGVFVKDGKPGMLRLFEEAPIGDSPLCFLNLTTLWKETP